ncbi:MAG: hypothetical protein RI554_10620, partial [Trueperaceae bacterium]|nr:hypothetical protein [Trueperaceae bacterium]
MNAWEPKGHRKAVGFVPDPSPPDPPRVPGHLETSFLEERMKFFKYLALLAATTMFLAACQQSED